MRILAIFILLYLNFTCFCQNECVANLKEYKNTIDTTKRTVYSFVETMPELTEIDNIMEFFHENMNIADSSSCFPLYIYYGFVVEIDSSISNVMICPELRFCDDTLAQEIFKQKLIEKLTTELLKQKSSVGILNGKKVAVFTIGRMHLDPQ